MKQTKFNRILSAMLAAVMLFALMVPSVSAAEPAAPQNLLGNPGFEDADPSETAGAGAWGKWNNAVRTTAEKHGGEQALQVSHFANGGSSSEQAVSGLELNKTYTFTIWAKLNKALEEGVPAPEIGAKGVRGSGSSKETLGEVKVPVTAAEWTEYTLEYTYLGGNACVYVWMDPAVANDVVIYADDASLTLKESGETPNPDPEPEPEQPALPTIGGLIADAGFEIDALGPGANPEVGHWNDYNYQLQTEQVHAGSKAVKSVAKRESTISRKMGDLIPGTTYELSAFIKGNQADKAGADPRLGVKRFGGNETNIPVAFNTTDWTRNAVQFTYTDANQDPEIYIWTAASKSNLSIYVDDMDLAAVDGVAAFTAVNGKLTVRVAGHNGPLTAEEFAATYQIAGYDAQPLTLTAEAATADSITLNFEMIPTAAQQQDVTVTLSYAAKQQVSGSFTIEADDSKAVVANMVSAQIENGTAAVVLDAVPNPLPAAKDFAVTYTEDGSAAKTAEVSSVQFEEASKTATVKFAPVAGSIDAAKDVVISVTYNGKTANSETIRIEKLTARTFYVAADGSDANDGLSEAAPFQTLEKINSLTLIPGDRVLFKKGDTFQGTLRPQGSGRESAPIVIASYGAGNQKPILEAKGQWQGEIQKAGGGGHTPVETVTYRGAIWLENIEYYEVRDLELVDPLYDANDLRVNEIPFYSAGVRVVNKNMGDLYHYVFDNLTIHGFRGPGSNFGKSAGGIQFNVMVDSRYPTDASKNVPSAMHDITVTNCEIYECGRSGINFLNPWGKREGEKWPGSQEGILPWHPFTNFYMANNVLHHIDGDALITDTTSNAVIEKNLCYETAIHLGEMGAAVGFFNWNSDDNYFQYNEVFNIGKDATKQDGKGQTYARVPGDAQGIEIDALNDRSWVQYNYVHDNYGGFMMWCNVSAHYPSYDGIVRYNISENDHMQVHGIFDIFPDMYGSETYNNVFYMHPETAVKNGKLKLYNNNTTATKDDHLVYNNIFYLTGNQSYPVETWGNTKIDWQSNIFCNIEDAPAGSNVTITPDEPLFVDPGKGYDPAKPVTAFRGLEQMRKDLEGYKLLDTAEVAIDAGQRCPSMDTGIPVGMTGETIPMHDFFGKTVTGIPDIGVHETDMVALKVISDRYTVDQKQNTITVPEGTTVQDLMNSLTAGEGVQSQLLRGAATPDGWLLAGDQLYVTNGKETRIYRIQVTAQNHDGEIPVANLTAVAGTQEDAQSNDVAGNVLKNDGSIWHSAWAGTPREDQWIYLQINDGAPAYKVTGVSILPRQDAAINGVITSYKLLGSNNGSAWTEITSGNWELADRSRKVIPLEGAAQTYTYYKLQVVDAASNSAAKFASLQEMRLLGHEVAAETVPAKPTGVQVSDITVNAAVVRWDAPANAEGIVSYVVKDAEGNVLARVSADKTQVTLAGLAEGTRYEGLTLAAENAFGVASEAAVIAGFETNATKPDPVTKVQVKDVTKTGATLTFEGAFGSSSGYVIKNGNQVLDADITNGEGWMVSAVVKGLQPGKYYELSVYNKKGELLSDAAMAPVFHTQIEDAKVTEVTDTTATITWGKLEGVNNYAIVVDGSVQQEVTGNQVKLTELNPETVYNKIQIGVITNHGGELEILADVPSFTTLAAPVPEKLNPVTNVQVKDITKTSATLTWNAPDGQTEGYVIKNGKEVLATLPADVTTYTATGLQVGTFYMLRVYNKVGNTLSEPADIIFPTQIAGATVTEVTDTTATIAWDELNLKADYYIVVGDEAKYPATTNPFTLENLKPGTTYNNVKVVTWEGTQSIVLADVPSFTTLAAPVPEKPESANKAELNQAVTEAGKITEEAQYTAESWAAFVAARKVAEKVQADPDATQEEVDKAVAALAAATAALEEKPVEPTEKPEPKPEPTEKPEVKPAPTEKPGTPAPEQKPVAPSVPGSTKTGDSSNLGMWIVLAVIGMAGAFCTKKYHA